VQEVKMVDNDIYKSKEKYESFKKNLNELAKAPKDYKRKYQCKNPKNLKYYREFFTHFETQDHS